MPVTGSGMGRRMMSIIYGYARVSTGDQTTDLQRDALEKANCDRILTDVASGAKAHRPELDHMLDPCAKATPSVWKLDRLGRKGGRPAKLDERQVSEKCDGCMILRR